jgi:lysophospholipase L1-like esterase
MTRKRGVLARLALAMGAVLISLVALEVAVRLLVAPSASQVLRGLHRVAPDRPWLYELVPGAQRTDRTSGVAYAINADGFRDHDRARTKPPAGFRMLVIGDSVSFGYGVALEATYAQQMEQRLRTSGSGAPFEVLNLGVSGYNPYTEAELLHGVGLGYAPDLVLTQFCVNDLNDPTLHFDTSTMVALGGIPDAAFPDPGLRARTAPRAGGIAQRACRWSRLCELLGNTLLPGPDRAALVASLAPHEAPSDGEIAWLAQTYTRMAADTKARGGTMVLVVFPYQTQLDASAPATLQAALTALGKQAGIPVIDLLPAFRRAAAEGGAPLFLDLWHPTARGHEIAAREILRALACAQLLPAGTGASCDA